MGVPGGARKVSAGMPDSLLRAHRGTHQSRDQGDHLLDRRHGSVLGSAVAVGGLGGGHLGLCLIGLGLDGVLADEGCRRSPFGRQLAAEVGDLLAQVADLLRGAVRPDSDVRWVLGVEKALERMLDPAGEGTRVEQEGESLLLVGRGLLTGAESRQAALWRGGTVDEGIEGLVVGDNLSEAVDGRLTTTDR